jgi:multicomponent Na+:H+ antiporter subunit D
VSAALAGVCGYLGLGVLGLVLGQGKILALFALAGGIASLTVWAPGFPESLVGGLPFGVAVAGDPWALGIWGLALTLHLAVLVQGWRKDGLYHSLITVLVGTCLAGGISRDLFNLYVVLELSSLLSVVLVAKEGRSAAVWAALRYLLLAGVGMTLYLFGLGLVYGRTGVLAIASLSQTDFSEPSLRIGVGLLLSGTAVKAGVFLLGLWLPPAHGQAPTEISALLSGVVVKLGIVTLARIAEAFPIEPVLLSLGILTGLGGLVYALWERDLKILLGHSTVSQLGYMLIGLGLGAREAALFYTVAHGLFKALLFLSAGMAVEAKGARTLAELKGGLPRPVVLGLALGTWAIVGLPPLAGFAGKNALSFASPTWAKALLQGLSLGTCGLFRQTSSFVQAGKRRFARGHSVPRGRCGGVRNPGFFPLSRPFASYFLAGSFFPGLWGIWRPSFSWSADENATTHHFRLGGFMGANLRIRPGLWPSSRYALDLGCGGQNPAAEVPQVFAFANFFRRHRP